MHAYFSEMENRKDEERDSDYSNSLMTPLAQALAMSPPRAPPHDSAHRTVLLAKNPSDYALVHHHDHERHHLHFAAIRDKLGHLLEQSHLHLPSRSRIPHPHLPAAPEWGDRVTRLLGVTLPVSWHNACRDSGCFRSIVDTIVTMSAPTMAIASPSLAVEFARLSSRCQKFQYGPHKMHVIHMFFPTAADDYKGLTTVCEPCGLLFFVHGGAWGSGLPWMYRLAASPFLKLGMAVAIVGYRTWPDGNVKEQVNDLEQAASFLAKQFPGLFTNVPMGGNPSSYGTCLMGHSSGAHIALLMLVDRARRKLPTGVTTTTTTTEPLEFHSYIGLSGPFDISHHFDYEAARGVEELSPMKPACGYSRDAFRLYSPALLWMRYLTEISECDNASMETAFPRILLIHGMEDSTVPFTATAEAARILRSCGITKCDEMYVARIGHQDTVMEVMMGGKTRDSIIEWLRNPSGSNVLLLATNSKL